MQVGIIGSGRVGTSIGKYLTDNQVDVTGFYDRHPDRCKESADFCQHTMSFLSIEEVVKASDTLLITTQDSEIASVWDCIENMSIQNKIICHFSGSLSSVVFQGIEKTGASGCSIHPMLAFSDKFSSYLQLKDAFFTIEGDEKAVSVMKELFSSLGNKLVEIDASQKVLYHCAASVLSNQVIAVIQSGFSMLESVGFDEKQVLEATASLITNNVANVLASGPVHALTGPIERGDVETVKKHMSVLEKEDKAMYEILGKKLVEIAKCKNPDRNYDEMMRTLGY